MNILFIIGFVIFLIAQPIICYIDRRHKEDVETCRKMMLNWQHEELLKRIKSGRGDYL